MSSRYRQRALPVAGAWHQYVSGSPTTVSNFSSFDYNAEIWDEVGSPGKAHTLTITKLDCVGFTPISGTSTVSPYNGSYFDNPCYGNLTTTCNHHLPLTLPSVGQETTKLLARTNPSRPVVTPLTLIQDMVEIPKMLHDVGKVLSAAGGNLPSGLHPKVQANMHLALSFGWAPLVEDIHNLLSLQQHIDRRAGELSRLYSVGGLKRRIHLGTYGAESTTANHLATSYAGGVVQGKLQRFTQCQRWGTVRWLPSHLPPYHPGEKELIAKARQVALGLSSEGTLEGVWDVIPWTWVIDWFANIGEFALAFSNTVPALSYEPCIMTHTVTPSLFTPTFRSSGLQGGNGLITYESKERTHDAIPTPSTTFLPFLGRKRLSILGALSIQKLLK
jgi:hypothetical protein